MIILDKNKFEQFYDLLEKSFPPDERRSFIKQKQLLDNNKYTVYARFENENLLGFLSTWKLGLFSYIEHFAVSPDFRNRGLGGKMLQETIGIVGSDLFLEVEPPESDITKRRIAFYERNGFVLNDFPYVQPAYGKDRRPLNLMIMTYKKPVTQSEFENTKRILYKEVYNAAESI